MHELVEIDSPADHDCPNPQTQRWRVLEPISGRWSWMTVFDCCGKVFQEEQPVTASPVSGKGGIGIQRAA